MKSLTFLLLSAVCVFGQVRTKTNFPKSSVQYVNDPSIVINVGGNLSTTNQLNTLVATVTGPNSYIVSWIQVSGPVQVTLGSPYSLTTTALFVVEGTYSFVFRVQQGFGYQEAVKFVTYTAPALPPSPTANFVGSPVVGSFPVTTVFTDLSTGTPTAWSWTFGDLGGVSSLQNPSHTYSAAGIYTVSLTVTNLGGTSTKTATAYVSVSQPTPPPVAHFTASPVIGTVPLVVTFTDTSSGGPTNWLWTFGDGQTATNQNIQHSYAAIGTYNVSLRVANPIGTNTTSTTGLITVNPVIPTNTPPTISAIANAVMFRNTQSAPASFTVGDAQTPVGNLTLSGTSSTTLFTPASFSFGGSGANRTVTVTPAANQVGTAVLTVTVNDGQGGTASTSFQATVNLPNTPPVFTSFPSNQSIPQDTSTGLLAFTVTDANYALNTLNYVVSASNPTLTPSSGMVIGGSNGNKTLTVTPAAGQIGSSTITVSVTNPGGGQALNSFTLTVTANTFNLTTSRTAPWSLVGIPGGIPFLTSQFCNIKQNIPGTNIVAVGDGVTDDKAAFAAALALCPSNQFVFVPAGTYVNTASVTSMRNGVVLRGAGMSTTKIITGTIYFPVNFGHKEVNMYGSASILAQGSSNVVATTAALPSSDTPGLTPAVGMFMTIGVTNDNQLIDPLGTGGNWRDVFSGFENKNMAQMSQITAISQGTNLTFWPPSVWNYSNSLGVVLRYYTSLNQRAGIEEITLETPTPHTQQHIVRMNSAAYCWLKNVKFNWAYEDAVYIAEAFRNNIEGCWIQNTLHSDSSGGYAFRPTETAPSWNLIQDNIIEGFRDPVIFEGGCGNVVAYNYAPWGTNVDTSTQHALSFHACSPAFNLFEGNKTWSSGADNTHGSSIYNTYLRNYLWGFSPRGATPGGGASTTYNWVNRLDRKAIGYSYLGNVFGQPGQSGTYEASSVFSNGARSASTRYIWTLGYVTDGSGDTNSSGGFDYDYSVRSNLIRQANYDYINNASVNPATVTNSLYLASKPGFFGSLQWPPIGPDIAGLTNVIPAELRYTATTNGPSVANFYVSPTGSASGPGTIAQPWDLLYALQGGGGLLQPGNVVQLRGGTYLGLFRASVSGSSVSNIVFDRYPGERPVLSGGNLGHDNIILDLRFVSYLTFKNMEILCTPESRITTQDGSFPTDITYPYGVYIGGTYTEGDKQGNGVKLINLVIHDTAQGISMWTSAQNVEVNGCLSYNNGWKGPDRGHGHDIYWQNKFTGGKLVKDSYVGYGFGEGCQGYTAESFLDYLTINGLIGVETGTLINGQRNMLLGGATTPILNPQIINCFSYYQGGPGVSGNVLNIGYDGLGAGSSGGKVADNWFLGGSWNFANTASLTCTNNKAWTPLVGFSSSQYPNNTYWSSEGATANTNIVRRCDYPTTGGRGFVVIYNPSQASSVSVSCSSIGLSTGESYELRNMNDYYAAPVMAGSWPGSGVLNIPMTGDTAAKATGSTSEYPPIVTPVPTGPKFRAFVLGRPSEL